MGCIAEEMDSGAQMIQFRQFSVTVGWLHLCMYFATFLQSLASGYWAIPIDISIFPTVFPEFYDLPHCDSTNLTWKIFWNCLKKINAFHIINTYPNAFLSTNIIVFSSYQYCPARKLKLFNQQSCQIYNVSSQ